MIVYCTSRNTGPSYHSDPIHMVYLGTSVNQAEAIVGDFTKYAKQEKDFPKEPFLRLYSGLPKDIDREMIQFFFADGWWYSIEMFDLS